MKEKWQKIRNSSKSKKRAISLTLSLVITIAMAVPYFFFSYLYTPANKPVVTESAGPLASIAQSVADSYKYIKGEVVEIFNKQ